MKPVNRGLGILLALILLFGCSACAAVSRPAPQATLRPTDTPAPAPAEAPASELRDVVILSTTDMHGKCWETNLLTGNRETHNMLRVSSAVRQIRETYGAEQVLLIDNGDLFQGTPVSQVQLFQIASGESAEPPAMALCLAEIGYDALVLGNHEFNYDWGTMSGTYSWLQDKGVAVLGANICYDGSDAAHARGDNAFTPCLIRSVTVNGHEHRIGLLGLENPDITRWDLPVNYPGLMFAHPENGEFSMVREAERYVTQMRAEGCEFIIVSIHSGLGSADAPLSFGYNTESQGLRIAAACEGIDLLITGHDHLTSYSNSLLEGPGGKRVPVVNGGGQELTKTVFRFSEDADGALCGTLVSTENLSLDDYEPDKALEAKIAPYAALAEESLAAPAGIAAGRWDNNSRFFTEQTDSMNLVCAAMMEMPSRRLAEKYGGIGPAALGVEGLDHLTVDMAFASVTSNGYTVREGEISMKDIGRLYRYANNVLVLPMTGGEIRAIMEENAANRLNARVLGGEARFFTKNDQYTNMIFGGLNFRYDLSKPAGQQVQIWDFADGRPFEEDGLYLVAVNNYILGNDRCGLRAYSTDDAVWAQIDDTGDTIQDLIGDYLRTFTQEHGALTPEAFRWHWKIVYTADPDAQPPFEGRVLARYAKEPEDGHSYLLYNEREGSTLTGREENGGLAGAAVPASGELLTGELPEDALVFTAHVDAQGQIALTDTQGRILCCVPGGGLRLSGEAGDDGLCLWRLQETYGGWNLVNAGTEDEQGLEYYGGCFTTYQAGSSEAFTFNFYETE